MSVKTRSLILRKNTGWRCSRTGRQWYFGVTGTRQQANGENHIQRSFMICTHDQISFGWTN